MYIWSVQPSGTAASASLRRFEVRSGDVTILLLTVLLGKEAVHEDLQWIYEDMPSVPSHAAFLNTPT